MKAFVITANYKNEELFLSTLFNKLGVPSKEMTAEELEDFGLLKMMQEADKSKKVSRSSIMKKLQSS